MRNVTHVARTCDCENGDLPDAIDLHFRRAPGFEHLSHAEYSKLLRDKIVEAGRAGGASVLPGRAGGRCQRFAGSCWSLTESTTDGARHHR